MDVLLQLGGGRKKFRVARKQFRTAMVCVTFQLRVAGKSFRVPTMCVIFQLRVAEK